MAQAAQFKDLIDDGWNRHGEHPEAVAATLRDALERVETADQAGMLARLASHVLGDHLGRWDDGVALLQMLHARFDDETVRRAIRRNQAALHYCAGRNAQFEEALRAGLEPDRHPASSQVRVLAFAAAALAAQAQTDAGMRALNRALELAEYGPDRDDPAASVLAATGNNLAVALEQKSERSAAETAMMIRAAEIARQYWEIAGGWLQVERAEYRLARSFAAAGRGADAARHAEACLRICGAHDAPGGERFFGFEALAHAHRAAGDAEAARQARDSAAALLGTIEDEDFASFCQGALNDLDQLLAQQGGFPCDAESVSD
jgi:hypothetical protein